MIYTWSVGTWDAAAFERTFKNILDIEHFKDNLSKYLCVLKLFMFFHVCPQVTRNAYSANIA